MRGVSRRFKQLALLFLVVLQIIIPISEVQASNPPFNANQPTTWYQSAEDTPYYNSDFEYCMDRRYGPCSCGVHAIAVINLKSGYWGKGKIASDGYQFAKEGGILNICITNGTNKCLKDSDSYDIDNLPAGYKYGPTYDLSKYGSATNNYIKHVADIRPDDGYHFTSEEAHRIVKQEYEKGHFMYLGVDLNGPNSGHAVVVDYVEDDGKVVIVDSGGRNKYLTDMYGVYNIRTLKVDGLKAYDAPKFWMGDEPFEEGHVDGADNTQNDSGTPNIDDSGSNNGLMQVEYEDKFVWEDRLVKYEEHQDRGHENKGVDKEDGFLNWLFR